jgi:hypothetical protein
MVLPFWISIYGPIRPHEKEAEMGRSVMGRRQRLEFIIFFPVFSSPRQAPLTLLAGYHSRLEGVVHS